MFIAVLFKIANIWKQPKCPSVDKGIKKAVVHLYSGIPHNSKKGGILTFWDRMDGPGDYYAK